MSVGKRCQSPMIAVQVALSKAQEDFQDRIGRCHGEAGNKVDDPSNTLQTIGKPSQKQLEAYANSLRPCVESEVKKIDSLLADVHALVPKSLADIKAVTPANVAQLDGGAAKSGGWFGK